MKKSSYIELCKQCTTLVIHSKGEKTSMHILIPINDKTFFMQLVRRQLFQTSILSETLYCCFFSSKNKTYHLVQIAQGYQTIKPHPHMASDIVELAQEFKSEAVVLCSTPIGSFLTEELSFITGEIIAKCEDIDVQVMDHILFKQNTNQCISLLEDEMLDYCHIKYKAMMQLKKEK